MHSSKPRFFRIRAATSVVFCGALCLTLAIAGCGNLSPRERGSSAEDQRERDEHTREDVARATEKMKPAIEDAGRKLGHAAEVAAEEARAAAQGVKDGWSQSQGKTFDINSATVSELSGISGITRREAERIVAGRPYRNTHQIVSKGILSEAAYAKVRDRLRAD